MEKETYCIECGDECDGSFCNDSGEPLCADCAEDLGYDGE